MLDLVYFFHVRKHEKTILFYLYSLFFVSWLFIVGA